MSENPSNKNVIGLGPQDNTQSIPSRYLIANDGMLRFIERGVPTENEHVMKKVRILQQYQWCAEEGKFDWYDIPLVDDNS